MSKDECESVDEADTEEEEEDSVGEHSDRSGWQATLAKVLNAVVVIKTNFTRNFDGMHAGMSEATGVDQGVLPARCFRLCFG